MTTGVQKSEGIVGTQGDALAARVRSGDREAMAEAVQRHGPLIKRYIRTRLSRSLRRLLDTGDVLGTVSRRLDLALVNGRLEVRSEQHLIALLQRMVMNAIVDQHRLLERLNTVEGEDSKWVRGFLQRTGDGDTASIDSAIDDAISELTDDRDQSIFSMWLHGLDHREIGGRLGMKPDAVRQRWQRIRTRLCNHFTESVP